MTCVSYKTLSFAVFYLVIKYKNTLVLKRQRTLNLLIVDLHYIYVVTQTLSSYIQLYTCHLLNKTSYPTHICVVSSFLSQVFRNQKRLFLLLGMNVIQLQFETSVLCLYIFIWFYLRTKTSGWIYWTFVQCALMEMFCLKLLNSLNYIRSSWFCVNMYLWKVTDKSWILTV